MTSTWQGIRLSYQLCLWPLPLADRPPLKRALRAIARVSNRTIEPPLLEQLWPAITAIAGRQIRPGTSYRGNTCDDLTGMLGVACVDCVQTYRGPGSLLGWLRRKAGWLMLADSRPRDTRVTYAPLRILALDCSGLSGQIRLVWNALKERERVWLLCRLHEYSEKEYKEVLIRHGFPYSKTSAMDSRSRVHQLVMKMAEGDLPLTVHEWLLVESFREMRVGLVQIAHGLEALVSAETRPTTVGAAVLLIESTGQRCSTERAAAALAWLARVEAERGQRWEPWRVRQTMAHARASLTTRLVHWMLERD